MKNEDFVIDTRPSIDKPEEIKLWVRAGGRCQMCNKYLLDIVYGVNLSEKAHIVGWKPSSKSPRGSSPLPVEDRNNVDNLMLLCFDHHKVIDETRLLPEFSVRRLMDIKKKQEHRIFHLTSMGPDNETVIIRLFSKIRGANVNISRDVIRQVVSTDGERVPKYLEGYQFDQHEINLEVLDEDENEMHLFGDAGKKKIDTVAKMVMDRVTSGDIKHLSVFAFARIPFLIYFGYKLDDKLAVTFYQYQRGREKPWHWDNDAKAESFGFEKRQSGNPKKITLLVSISAAIDIDKVLSSVGSDTTIYEILPKNGSLPRRDILLNQTSFYNFSKTYRDFLSYLELNYPGITEIQLIPAVPLTVAIACGQGLMKNVHPKLTIYDFVIDSYIPTITINEAI